MAAAKKEIKTASSLTPNASLIKLNGLEVILPADKQENAMLAILLACQGRAFIQRSLKKWQDDEQWPSPKELRDIMAAIKDANESCGAVFDTIELPAPKTEKPAEKIGEGLDFTNLTSTTLEVTEEKKP